MKKGFLYILRNEAMPGLLKIGYSVKVPTERVGELFTTGVPEPFTLSYYCIVENAEKLEAQVHQNLSVYRHRGNREFFRLELQAAVQSITTICKPEHEWFEKSLQQISQSNSNTQILSGTEISIESRHDLDGEIKQMEAFVDVLRLRSLTPYVRSLFYDSNACICFFEFSDEMEPYSPIANELLEIALETIGQFEWFGQVRHGCEF